MVDRPRVDEPSGDAPPGDELARLRAGAAALGAPLDDAQARGLLRLLDELAQWNRAYNLTAITARPAMLTHHLLDSLAGSRFVAGERVLDLGTGAGFPGLPLALLHPGRRFTLLDGTAKKVRFVAHAARTLGLANVEAVHGRAGEWQPAGRFDLVLARAVAPITELARLARPMLAPGGRLLAWKGQRREAEAELAALRAQPGQGGGRGHGNCDDNGDDRAWGEAHINELRVPGLDAERCVVEMLRG